MVCFCKCHLNAGPCCNECNKLFDSDEIKKIILKTDNKYQDYFSEIFKRLHCLELEVDNLKLQLSKKHKIDDI